MLGCYHNILYFKINWIIIHIYKDDSDIQGDAKRNVYTSILARFTDMNKTFKKPTPDL